MGLNDVLKMEENRNNVPIHSRKSVPNEHLAQISTHTRKYLKRAQVKELAEKNYSENGRGITVLDVMTKFKVKQGTAQRTLKNLHTNKFLFTGEDLQKQRIIIKGLKREKPQKYYLTEMKARIIEDNKNNVSNGTTGSGPCLVDIQRIRSFQGMMCLYSMIMLYIHKIQMMTSIDRRYYKEILNAVSQSPAKKIVYDERIGQRHGPPNVRYILHGNGTIMIYVSCSENPFRLCHEEDVSAIMTFMGRVEDRLRRILSDTGDQIVKPPSEWILKGCDVNKDMEIGETLHLSMPGFYMKLFEKALRGYVKVVENRAYYRLEESVTPNLPLPTALEELRTKTDLEKSFSSLFNP